jgi:hypothetical protein
MDDRNPPPWRTTHLRPPPKLAPPSTIPSKRSADTQEAAWVADEDRFVLQQAKKKAAIRVKGGRAKPIDWLAVTLRTIDPTKNALDDEVDESELDVVDPEGVLEDLNDTQLEELEKDIDVYLTLETNRSNQEYWSVSRHMSDSTDSTNITQTMKVICKDRRQKSKAAAPEARGISSVSADVDRLLEPKTYEQLEVLEKQIRAKLDSNQPIDVDYWEHLLRSLMVWKAKAKLRRVSQAILSSRMEKLRKQQQEESDAVRTKLQTILGPSYISNDPASSSPSLDASLDPEPSLKIRPEDKALETIDERSFLEQVVRT